MEETQKYEYSGPYSISRKNSGKVAYDMYRVKLIGTDGQTTQYNVFTEPNVFEQLKDLNLERRNKVIEWFLIKRLLGEKGLIKMHKNGNYIYAGRIEKQPDGKLLGDSNVCIDPEKGITKRQIFDEDLPFLTQMLKGELEKKQEGEMHIDAIDIAAEKKKKIGKKYAISDIHGMYGSYAEVMSNLNPDDTLYIIGDAIDRGKNGIKIILDIIERQQNPEINPQINFICGNHEFAFYQGVKLFSEMLEKYKANNPGGTVDDREVAKSICRYLEIKMRMAEGNSEKNEVLNEVQKEKGLDRLKSQFKLSLVNKTLEGYSNELNEISNKQLNGMRLDLYERVFSIWLINNKAKDTFLDFMQLDKENRAKVMNFIENSYISFTERVGDKKLLLVHAMPPYREHVMTQIEGKNYTLKEFMRDGDRDSLKAMLEMRKPRFFALAQNHGFETIYGHDPEEDCIIHEHPEDESIMIDAACGHGGNLALYCMDDRTVKYFPEKENEQQKQGPNFGDK